MPCYRGGLSGSGVPGIAEVAVKEGQRSIGGVGNHADGDVHRGPLLQTIPMQHVVDGTQQLLITAHGIHLSPHSLSCTGQQPKQAQLSSCPATLLCVL